MCVYSTTVQEIKSLLFQKLQILCISLLMHMMSSNAMWLNPHVTGGKLLI